MNIEVDPVLQPVAKLPEDILHLIVSAYVAARAEENALNFSRRRSDNKGAEWPILPLLLSSKLLYELIVPKLYRNVKLPRSGSLRKFINAPAVESYRYIRCLEVFDSEEISAGDIDSRLTHCLFQHIAKLPACNIASTMDLKTFEALRAIWVESHRPIIELVRFRGQARHAVEGLLAL